MVLFLKYIYTTYLLLVISRYTRLELFLKGFYLMLFSALKNNIMCKYLMHLGGT